MPQIPIKYMPVFSKNFLYKKTEDQSKYKNIIIRFLYETGIRASEINKIIEINKETLLLKGKGQKIREIFHNYETSKKFNGFEFSQKTLRI
jgi:integrase/recombinase XerD